jgi:hypothetical protein
LKSSKPHVRLDHVIIFSDGIFAFSITIVRLSIQIPQLPNNLDETQIQAKLWDMRPYFEKLWNKFCINRYLLDILS